MLVGQRHLLPALEFASLADGMWLFVQNEVPALSVWEFLALPGLALAQLRDLIGQISSLVMDLG